MKSVPLPKRQIMVIDPAVNVPELDTFNHMAGMSEIPLSFHMPGLHGFDSMEFGAARTPVAGIVILGSSANVDQHYAWQQPLVDWLNNYIYKDIPVLGICYGHQLLGHMFGADVGYLHSDKKKLQGFRNVRVDKNSKLWRDIPTSGPLYVAHRQVVRDVTNDIKAVITSDDVNVDGLEHRKYPVWGLQPHPEATANFIKNQGIHPLPDDLPKLLQFGHTIVAHFLRFVAANSPIK